MWKVKRGDVVVDATEAFGAVCVDEAGAKKLSLVSKESPLPTSRGTLEGADLYALDDLARASGLKGCSADRAERLYTIPAAEKPAKSDPAP